MCVCVCVQHVVWRKALLFQQWEKKKKQCFIVLLMVDLSNHLKYSQRKTVPSQNPSFSLNGRLGPHTHIINST